MWLNCSIGCIYFIRVKMDNYLIKTIQSYNSGVADYITKTEAKIDLEDLD